MGISREASAFADSGFVRDFIFLPVENCDCCEKTKNLPQSLLYIFLLVFTFSEKFKKQINPV